MNDDIYFNDIYEALHTFWKCRRSKFETTNNCTQVDRCVDTYIIADNFCFHFKNTFACNNMQKAESL